MQENDIQVKHSQGLSQHQILLLLLVSYGLETPYDLLSKAGLGVGQTSPSLKRMKQDGLLSDYSGPRNSVRYALTNKGRDALRHALISELVHYQQPYQSESFETLPRGIVLAWINSGPDEARKVISAARAALGRLAQKRGFEAEKHENETNFLTSSATFGTSTAEQGKLVAETLQWLKAEFDRELFQLQEKALERLTDLIQKLPPAPRLPLDR